MDWYGDEWLERQKAAYTVRVNDAGENLAEAMRTQISVQGPPRSLPGDPPHMDTTALHESIEVIPGEEGDLIFASIGTAIFYGILLEYGRSNCAPRPWLLRTLLQEQDAIMARIAGEVDTGGGGI